MNHPADLHTDLPSTASMATAAANPAPRATRVGDAPPHESAHLHVTGRAAYVDDLPELAGTLHVALGLAPVAGRTLHGVDLAVLRAQPGVVAVLTADDIPGVNDCGAIVHDDPILAVPGQPLRHVGQPVFAVVAGQRGQARRAAALAKTCVQVADDAQPLLLTPEAAHAAGQYVLPPMHLARSAAAGHRSGGDGPEAQAAQQAVRAALAAAPHRLQEAWDLGGQEQFYLEGQISYAVPQDDGGLLVHCSTQHPSEMQHLVAHALGLASHRVQVQCRRMGGGFGGKESQSALFACVAAVAAQRLGRPVKLRLDRDDDFLVTGRRHCFRFDVDAGFDDQGRILAVEATLLSRAGHSADLSGPVMTRALCHFDNAYWLPEVALHGFCCRTHTQSNTAFRGFGGPQGAVAIEYLIEGIARRLGLDALDVRRANFYARTPGQGRDVTPYGQTVADNVVEPLVAELEASCAYRDRRAAIAAFNAASPVLKRGLALTPVKFGISFNVKHFNQAGALVHVYTDGSVLVNHGGTEMGQGLNTKVAQVVAHELGLPLAWVRVTATDTQKVANTSATAASTGSDLNGKAAQDAARQIRQRLQALAAARHGAPGLSPEQVRLADGHAWVDRGQGAGERAIPWAQLVSEAYTERVQLWSDGFYATPGLSWDRDTLQGRPFYYFAYGAACSEVLVDTLTGEWRLLQADLLHDVGRSLNPALDIGQIEGAFIQGMGWLTTEELVWHPTTGVLSTHAPSTYKIPTANDCPTAPGAFSTRLFDNGNVEDSIHRSKAVGEPPLLLPFSVFFAIRDAIGAVGDARQPVPLRAPATAEAILDAVVAMQGGA